MLILITILFLIAAENGSGKVNAIARVAPYRILMNCSSNDNLAIALWYGCVTAELIMAR